MVKPTDLKEPSQASVLALDQYFLIESQQVFLSLVPSS